jgi:hypothetical protein
MDNSDELPDANTQQAIEAAILTLLAQRKPGATICPSEAARLHYTNTTNQPSEADGWRQLMGPVRGVARIMAQRGVIEITQKGEPVDPQHFTGPIRLRTADTSID